MVRRKGERMRRMDRLGRGGRTDRGRMDRRVKVGREEEWEGGESCFEVDHLLGRAKEGRMGRW